MLEKFTNSRIPQSFEILKYPEQQKDLNPWIIITGVNGVGKDFLLRRMLSPNNL